MIYEWKLEDRLIGTEIKIQENACIGDNEWKRYETKVKRREKKLMTNGRWKKHD
jgi:hypothetical protein